ncbi:MAG: pilin [Candidatus Moranbacteria bacterium]|nr:pilin [Candidatus Moranbacteria bacterium]
MKIKKEIILFFLLVVVGLAFSKNIYAACVAGSPCTLDNPVDGSFVGKCTPEGACFPVTTGSAASELTAEDNAINDLLRPGSSSTTPTDEAVNDFLHPTSTVNSNSLPGSSQVNNLNSLPGATKVTPAEGVHIPTAAETGLSDVGIKALLMSLLRWLLGIVGVIALIGFVISGIQYIISSGNEDMAKTAKQNMTNAIIGIVVVMASLVIIQAIDYALRGYSVF